MPQTDTFMAEHDLYYLIQFLLDQDCVLVPDLIYTEPSLLMIDSMREFEKRRTNQGEKLFFVLSESWQNSPLEFGQYKKEERTLYYIKQKVGGPTLDIFAPNLIVQENRCVLPHGYIGYHSRFWNPTENTNEVAPDTLKSAYRKATKHLGKDATKVKLGQRTYLIANNARKKLEEGYVLGPPFDSE